MVVTIERYLLFNNFEESRWVEYSVTLLSGRALLWYNRITFNDQNNFISWPTFKTALDLEFRPQFAARSARDRLFEVKQTTSVQQYIHAFQDILLEVSITDDEAIDKFIRGLKDRARAHVIMQDPVDLESAYQCATAFESATIYGHSTRTPTTASSQYIDDPMDTSVNMIQQLQRQNNELLNALQRQGQFNNQTNRQFQQRPASQYQRDVPLCFVCDKPGHFARDCYHRNNTRRNNGSTEHRNNFNNNRYNNSRNNNNNNNNIGSRTSYNFRNTNNNNKQSFNAILDQYDPLFHDNNNSSYSNKDLIDLAPSGSQDNANYFPLSPVSIDDCIISPSDYVYLNNLQNSSPALPLYSAMVGGSKFKILIDSGASTCYVHPKLMSYALKISTISNQAVETADGNQSKIDKKIEFKMFLGNAHEYQEIITAFVFESKFDIILGRNWLKQRSPIPDWFDDTWTINTPQGDVKLQPIPQKHDDIRIQAISDKDNNAISQQLFSSSPISITTNTIAQTTDSTDYLLSANQVSRLLKKDEVEECFMLYFINDDTGNNSLISLLYSRTIQIYNLDIPLYTKAI
ncbi:hypothetical protein HPULCUR_002181 [Helicostylum pulchrum]|uniref:CCHC-type domain-containing protein n=1 Tax=Helicostylum pulchrum TaxID=562976 RepID=A0ABP9XRA1_9FUNG